MPKEKRTKLGTRGHSSSVQLEKRAFAVQENAVEKVQVGEFKSSSAEELLIEASRASQLKVTLTKKEKKSLKHEALLDRLESTRSPYSKVQRRRFKKKQAERIGGGLDDIQSALRNIDVPATTDTKKSNLTIIDEKDTQFQSKPKPGQIGAGKSKPLTKAQRNRALELEKFRHPLILSNPDFAANPFQTIRTHAINTLIKAERQ